MTLIKQHMSDRVYACDTRTPLSEVAHIMWDKDCGFVPVLEATSKRLVGVITDRDICMAAYTQGRPLREILAGDVMTGRAVACRDSDELGVVHELMRRYQIRRLPVMDAQQRVVGVVSLNDLAVHAAHDKQESSLLDIAETLGEISHHRLPVPTRSGATR